jgi:lipopolysaccharide/colanic/teichoic acid biosynthesis glycosyltransferase
VRQLVSENKFTVNGTTNVAPWKRGIDLIAIFVSLPIWLAVFVVIAFWIKLVSRGPLFFCQERLGFKGKPFKIFKFRTMEVNVETRTHEEYLEHLINANCPMTKLDASGDPRIIFGGRVLRATGLDELPQLFNVLRKEMSLVGPRPCTPNEARCYKDWQHERFNALPGLTGYWQVNGKNKTTFSQMIEMDIHYTRYASFWLDVSILLRTVPAILGQVIESRISAHRRQIQVGPGPQEKSRPFGGAVVEAEKSGLRG